MGHTRNLEPAHTTGHTGQVHNGRIRFDTAKRGAMGMSQGHGRGRMGITRFVEFPGATPAESFTAAADWLSEHADELTVTAVSWTTVPPDGQSGLLVHWEPA
jgi:hypothetical protein